eukprot:9496723-Pyramimonas_sp.AAC.1
MELRAPFVGWIEDWTQGPRWVEWGGGGHEDVQGEGDMMRGVGRRRRRRRRRMRRRRRRRTYLRYEEDEDKEGEERGPNRPPLSAYIPHL